MLPMYNIYNVVYYIVVVYIEGAVESINVHRNTISALPHSLTHSHPRSLDHRICIQICYSYIESLNSHKHFWLHSPMVKITNKLPTKYGIFGPKFPRRGGGVCEFANVGKGFIKSIKQSTGPFQWLDIVSTFYRIHWLLLCAMASVHKRLVPGDISTVVTLSLSLPSSNLTLNLYELSFNSSWVDILRSGDGASLVWIFYDHWERVLACCCWKIDWVGLQVSRRG